MVHAIRPVSRPHPDANRIAGLAVAIAIQAALLMLLLVPLQAPPALQKDFRTQVWTLPQDKTPPAPKPPPIKAPVTKPQQFAPVPMPIRPPQPQAATARDDVVVDDGSEPVVPGDGTGPAIEPSVGPVPGVRLEYAQAPPPTYPRDALREGITGTVTLQVLVDVDGRPLDVQVARSSGNRSLDRVAREQVLKRWRFRPAMQDGHPVQAIGLVPIDFRLD
jgi:protein TonB